MNQLSDRLNRLSPSATLAMSQKSSELKAQGVDVINLSVGEPDFNTPDHIKEAAKKAVDDNFSRYSPVPGYPALRNAIVAKLKNENGLDYSNADVHFYNNLAGFLILNRMGGAEERRTVTGLMPRVRGCLLRLARQRVSCRRASAC